MKFRRSMTLNKKELAKKQYEDFKAKLYAKDEIQGFKLTPKMKDNLWDFIMKPDKLVKQDYKSIMKLMRMLNLCMLT